MKLSEAIRLGAMLKPQTKVGYLVADNATCAMGAALDAVGALPVAMGRADDVAWEDARRRWPILLMQVAHPTIALPYGLGWTVAGIIPDLNDTENWAREQIADWVETIEQQHDAVVSITPQADMVTP